MNCIEGRLLREYLDGELAIDRMAEIEQHLENCYECQQRLSTIASNEQFVNAVLSRYGEQVEAGTQASMAAWAKLKTKTNNNHKRRLWGLSTKYRRWVAAAAAVLILGTLSFGDVRAAMAEFLSVFRMERIETISVTPQEMAQIQDAVQKGIGNIDVENFGKIEVNGKHEVVLLHSLDEGSKIVDFPLKSLQLEGYNELQVRVEKSPSLSLALNVDNVNAMIKNLNGSKFLPAELNNKSFTVSMSDALTMEYRSSEGLDPVSLVQMKSPELLVPGEVDVEAVRDALLSLPLWPDNVRQQLAAVDDWRHTVVIPNIDEAQEVTVHGQSGIFVNQPRGGQNCLVWSEDGMVYSLQGTLTLDQALQIADSLR